MKRFQFLLTLVFIATCLVGCGQRSDGRRWYENSAAEDSVQTEYFQAGLRFHLRYLKDQRTHLCYAIYDDGGAQRGPTMVLVPWEIVPDSLATIITPETK